RKIYDIIKNHNKPDKPGKDGWEFTLEFYPEEGMYHFDGHRDCDFSCEPAVSRKLKNICPKCRKPLTIGVLNRVEELADRPLGFKPKNAVPFKKLVELDKIIAEALDIKSRNSQAVRKQYNWLIKEFGSELFILLELDLAKTGSRIDPRISEGIKRVRSGDLIIKPGFDGQYGKINIFPATRSGGQKSLL
ncbi:MAG: DNA helicase UvrD, partial [Candidatus Paceibacterota bacterium]